MVAAVSTVGGYGQTVDVAGAVLSDPVMTTKHGIASLGQLFVSTNPTPGTALTYNAQTTFSATVPFLYLFNSSAVKNVYVDAIKIIMVTASAGSTSVNYAINLDTAARTFSPDNTLAITPVNTNALAGTASVLTVKAQNSGTASAVSAAASPKLIGRGNLGGLTILGDELVIDFGADDIAPYGSSATAGRKTSASPAFCLCPGFSLTMGLWLPAGASFTYELEMSHWER